MKTTAVVALAVLLAACGGDDDNDDNGGNGGNSVTLTGGTTPGTLSNGTGARLAGLCDPGTGTEMAFAAGIIAVTTAPNVCSAVQAGREPANSTTLFISLSKVAMTGTSTALDAGTYPQLGASIPTPDAQGNIRFAFIGATKSGASAGTGLGCQTVAEASASSGTVTITSVTASNIAGSVTATLDNGTTVSGSFSVPTCGLTLTVDPTTCDILGLPDTTSCG